MTVPLENIESKTLTIRLENYLYRFSSIRNESDKNSFYKGKKRKAEGVRSGIPDFCIILKRGSICFIELKRKKTRLKNGKLGKSPSNIKPEQIEWCKELNEVNNVYAKICFGAEEAILFIIECEAK